MARLGAGSRANSAGKSGRSGEHGSRSLHSANTPKGLLAAAATAIPLRVWNVSCRASRHSALRSLPHSRQAVCALRRAARRTRAARAQARRTRRCRRSCHSGTSSPQSPSSPASCLVKWAALTATATTSCLRRRALNPLRRANRSHRRLALHLPRSRLRANRSCTEQTTPLSRVAKSRPPRPLPRASLPRHERARYRRRLPPRPTPQLQCPTRGPARAGSSQSWGRRLAKARAL